MPSRLALLGVPPIGLKNSRNKTMLFQVVIEQVSRAVMTLCEPREGEAK